MATIKVFRHKKIGRWHVEVIRSTTGALYVITVDGWRGWNDNPIRYQNGQIAYDFPERIPQYAKQLTRVAFDWLDQRKEAKDVLVDAV